MEGQLLRFASFTSASWLPLWSYLGIKVILSGEGIVISNGFGFFLLIS